MLTGMQVAIIGGDLRQVEVIRKLSKRDASLQLIGFEFLDNGFLGAEKKTFQTSQPENLDAIVLPINGISTDQEVESHFSGEKQILTEKWLGKIPNHTKIYTGIANETLYKLVNNVNHDLVELMNRDDLAIYNSIPTAEGTVMLVMQNTNITIHQSNIIVTGFGRIGQSIARIFYALGANVCVVAREEELLARAFEMNLKTSHLSNLESIVEEADIVVNTIPAHILSSNILAKMSSHVFILDLASKPGGTDFDFAKKRAIKAILAPGLPGLVAPKTAGIQLGNLLATLLEEQWKA